VMHPNRRSTHDIDMNGGEVIALNEVMVDHHGVRVPTESPSPAAPTTASHKGQAKPNWGSPFAPHAHRMGRVIPHRIRIVNRRRAPNPYRIIDWHVNYLWVGGLNF